MTSLTISQSARAASKGKKKNTRNAFVIQKRKTGTMKVFLAMDSNLAYPIKNITCCTIVSDTPVHSCSVNNGSIHVVFQNMVKLVNTQLLFGAPGQNSSPCIMDVNDNLEHLCAFKGCNISKATHSLQSLNKFRPVSFNKNRTVLFFCDSHLPVMADIYGRYKDKNKQPLPAWCYKKSCCWLLRESWTKISGVPHNMSKTVFQSIMDQLKTEVSHRQEFQGNLKHGLYDSLHQTVDHLHQQILAVQADWIQHWDAMWAEMKQVTEAHGLTNGRIRKIENEKRQKEIQLSHARQQLASVLTEINKMQHSDKQIQHLQKIYRDKEMKVNTIIKQHDGLCVDLEAERNMEIKKH